MLSMFTPALMGMSLVGGVFGAPRVGQKWTRQAQTPNNTAAAVEGSATSFPALQNASLIPQLEALAHGTLSNNTAPPPHAFAPDTITAQQFVEFNENFEQAFFKDLLFNITSGNPDFKIPDSLNPKFVEDVLIATIAQEELHAINADKALKGQNATTIQPCIYKFPSNTFEEAITFATTFTDVTMGTLQDVLNTLAGDGDGFLTPGVGSVIGQEGEQNGFYRLLQNKNLIPNELPFLTRSVLDFAFSALEQGVIVSCPNDNILKEKVSIFGVLNLDTPTVKPEDAKLQFSFDFLSLENSNLGKTGSAPNTYEVHGTTYGPSYDWSKLSLVYINQQNVPVVVPLENQRMEGTVVHFEALFPFVEHLLNGLTITALTTSAGPFATVADVANATLFGPALIEVN